MNEQDQSINSSEKKNINLNESKFIKNSLIVHLKDHYTKFIAAIQNIPGEMKSVFDAFEYFDAGFLSLQKGIILVNSDLLPPLSSFQLSQPQLEANSQMIDSPPDAA